MLWYRLSAVCCLIYVLMVWVSMLATRIRRKMLLRENLRRGKKKNSSWIDEWGCTGLGLVQKEYLGRYLMTSSVFRHQSRTKAMLCLAEMKHFALVTCHQLEQLGLGSNPYKIQVWKILLFDTTLVHTTIQSILYSSDTLPQPPFLYFDVKTIHVTNLNT